MKSVARIAVTVILIGIVLWAIGGPQKVIDLLAGMKVHYVLLALIANMADRMLMTYKWIQLLRGKHIHLPFWDGMKIYCASMIWGIFLPSTVGADAIRVFVTSRWGIDSREIIASILIERMIGFLCSLLLGLGSLFLLSSLTTLDLRFHAVWWTAAGTLLIGLLAFGVSFSHTVFDVVYERVLRNFRHAKIIEKLRQFHFTYLQYRQDRANLIQFAGLTFCEQLLPITWSWLIAMGMGIPVGLAFVAGAVPLSILAARLPVSIDGLGVYEGVFALLMGLAGVSASEAVAIAVAGRIIQTVAWLPWWAAHVIQARSLRPPRPLEQEN